MQWADAVPNLMIGLREGLEAGLVVSILLAVLRKIRRPEDGTTGTVSTAPVWLGVLGAVTVAGSFATILTFSTDVLSSRAQQIVGGSLSVLAVFLVTGMVFWMRRTAMGLSAQLRGEVERAVAIGAGALTLTAFLAVGREGLETTLFLWTAVKASGTTVAPLTGAALGLGLAILLCWLLYRRAVKLNLGVFFSRTAFVLIVIAAGVLSYGLGDLQDGGVLPGQSWVAFDLAGTLDPNSWWVSLISGVTELTPRMTVLQVTAWLVYLAVVIPLFVKAGRQPVERKQVSEPEPAGKWERLAGKHTAIVAGALVLVPVAVAALVIAALPQSATGSAISVTDHDCAPEWKSAPAGTQSITVTNKTAKAGEIRLDDSSGGIVAEIETIGPATSATMSATLADGSYTFHCLMSGQSTTASAPVQVSGGAANDAPAPVKPVTTEDLTGPNQKYLAYAAQQLGTVSAAVGTVRADLAANNTEAAKKDWLTAQLAWERVGASYNSFGDTGTAVDGLPNGLPANTADPGFTGLHRLEYGLWHGQAPASLVPVADQLAQDLASLRGKLATDDVAGDPTKLPIRAHEILEDAIRDHLSGMDNQGSGTAYAATDADLDVTRIVLAELTPLLNERAPNLVKTAAKQLTTLHEALVNHAPTTLAQRQAVNGAAGAVVETLSAVPTLLEVPPSH
ncbi:iron uptake transporter permease EfeU [Amycolatopsis dendrobii]|uniref:FTR1 family protein n=1 Tax=Amycolatopsis dendrobii TaxID=2760662 RepID=A0A7W3ZC10_9PSEU|nr:iron uptake transporter permease EfeU [Amycolatopsis dendrobii]MBB1155427.1 FTR1 family protein [Amycolatopsis dendrobii]